MLPVQYKPASIYYIILYGLWSVIIPKNLVEALLYAYIRRVGYKLLRRSFL